MNDWDIEVFYDGDCPLCLREVNMLRRLDRGRGRILFTDIADEAFDAGQFGRTHDELMAEIHGRLPDGSWLVGVEVFRRLYEAVGLTAAVRLTRLPGVDWTLGRAYELFARNRLRLTGRCRDEQCTPQPA